MICGTRNKPATNCSRSRSAIGTSSKTAGPTGTGQRSYPGLRALYERQAGDAAAGRGLPLQAARRPERHRVSRSHLLRRLVAGRASRAGHLLRAEGPFHCNPRVPIYTIPYRILYSVNIENLLFAGQHLSTTHIGLGTLRVQGTLSTVGQAAGTAAALCLRSGQTPANWSAADRAAATDAAEARPVHS